MSFQLPAAGDETLAYCSIRSTLLSGDGPGFTLWTADLSEKASLPKIDAKRVVLSLAADRYYDDRRRVKGAELTKARGLGWFDAFTLSVRSALLNVFVLSQLDKREIILGAMDACLDATPSEETSISYITTAFASILEAASRPHFSYVYAEMIPPAFFRILWTSDVDDLVPMALAGLADIFASGELERAQSEFDLWFCGIRSSYEEFFERRSEGSTFGDRVWKSSVRDRGLSGRLAPAERFEQVRLLPDL